MDQHEKNWLDLGRQLKDYQPAGEPADDFLEFHQLQKKEKPYAFAWWIRWGVFPLLLLVLAGTLYLVGDSSQPAKAQDKEPPISASSQITNAGQEYLEVPLAGEVDVAEKPGLGNSIPAAKAGVLATGQRSSGLVARQLQPSASNESGGGISGKATRAIRPGRAQNKSSFNPPPASPNRYAGEEQLRQSGLRPLGSASVAPDAEEVLPLVGADSGAKVKRSGAAFSPQKLVASSLLPRMAIAELPVKKRLPVLVAGANKHRGGTFPRLRPRLVLGGGLSNHWRGENFLEDVDQGLYVNLGLYQPLSKRFAIEGHVGYRAHDLIVPVFSGAKEPWSYHKDEIHNTGQMGQTRVYIYEGIVDSYRAVELSLLVHYQLQPQISLHAGARYALPSIKFRRLVHGPDDENPFHDFIEEQEMVKNRDYGGLLGFNYRFSNRLSLQGEVHLGLVDLIENAAQEGDGFNRSNSLSVGFRYSFE